MLADYVLVIGVIWLPPVAAVIVAGRIRRHNR